MNGYLFGQEKRMDCVHGEWSEELLRTFSFATTRAKVANSGKMVIARYRIRYCFQKRAALPLTLLEN